MRDVGRIRPTSTGIRAHPLLRHSTFTRTEVLVVVALIVILAGLLVPVYVRARVQSHISDCVSSLHQIAATAGMYTSHYDGYIPYARDPNLAAIDPGALPPGTKALPARGASARHVRQVASRRCAGRRVITTVCQGAAVLQWAVSGEPQAHRAMPPFLSEPDLAGARLRSPDRAVALVRSLSGAGVSDDELRPLLPLLLSALKTCPDPDRALTAFARWFGAVGSRYAHLQTLIRHPVSLDLFCLVTGTSQYFADLLARQPECFEILANPGVRGGAKSTTRLYGEVSALIGACRQPELKRDALRRWKAREMLRIGVRDIAGLATMPATALEFSNLADACVRVAYEQVVAEAPLRTGRPPALAVIAMGKLGGRELNYSSDIDLIFVAGEGGSGLIELETGRRMEVLAYLTGRAEALIRLLAEDAAHGHVFRVDVRLRPEGRFGPLVRSLEACRAYYESWADSWEIQALIKARFVCGASRLGKQFLDTVDAFVYRRRTTSVLFDDIRANKRRIESRCAIQGETARNVKTGYGGIRDIEFIVQLLQIRHGSDRPELRVSNTLLALTRLRRAGLIAAADARALRSDYVFLRNLEHRLQLLNGFQTQTLPAHEEMSERLLLARRMGFATLAEFESTLSSRRRRARELLERLFYQDRSPDHRSVQEDHGSPALLELLDNIDTQAARSELASRLKDAGLIDTAAAIRALSNAMRGNEFGGMPPDTPVEFKAVAPRLLALITASADPDAALAGLESLALAVPNRAQLYASFDDSPDAMRRVVHLAAGAPPLFKLLVRHLEWYEAILGRDEPPRSLASELTERVRSAPSFDAKLVVIAKCHLRESIRLASNDLWAEAALDETMEGFSDLADTILSMLLSVCSEAAQPSGASDRAGDNDAAHLAVLGLGKLGGRELGYGSDWDALVCYREPADASRRGSACRYANDVAERLVSAFQRLRQHGAPLQFDLRLRPWGKQGALVCSRGTVEEYYGSKAEPWERQAALKARLVAGDSRTGRQLEGALRRAAYRFAGKVDPTPAMRAMKVRIESERLRPQDRYSDLKLGWGGLTDVEWIAQRLQLVHGRSAPGIRAANTLDAIAALAAARLLSPGESETLTATYRLLMRARNAMRLRSETPTDILPADPGALRPHAIMLGYHDTDVVAERRLLSEIRLRMKQTRRILLRHFGLK